MILAEFTLNECVKNRHARTKAIFDILTNCTITGKQGKIGRMGRSLYYSLIKKSHGLFSICTKISDVKWPLNGIITADAARYLCGSWASDLPSSMAVSVANIYVPMVGGLDRRSWLGWLRVMSHIPEITRLDVHQLSWRAHCHMCHSVIAWPHQ